MREIKFRAWNNETRSMYKWDELSRNPSSLYNALVGSVYGHDRLQMWSVMQSTSLKDKNGVEIYEGDICDFIIGNQSPSKGTRHEIIWLRCAWGFEPLFPSLVHIDDREPRAFYVDPFEGDDWDANDFSVIGNIHENPELLE